MMSSDNQWGGKPRRYHNLGVLPWNEANKIPTMSHYLGDTLPFYLCCMWQVGVSNCQNFEVYRSTSFQCKFMILLPRARRAMVARIIATRGEAHKIALDISHQEEVRSISQ